MIVPSKTIQLKDATSLELRSVRPDESKKMLEHLIITHGESYRNVNRDAEAWKKVSVEDEQKVLQSFQDSSKGFMMVALDQGTIIAGLGMMVPEAGARSFNGDLGMSIQNKYRGKGLGLHMMNDAIEQSRKNGLHRIELSVRTYNADAIYLYEKCGFQRVGLLKEVALIDGQFVDEYLYQLLLT
jgi:RimJ/RimL family protein N-acetyltransferase